MNMSFLTPPPEFDECGDASVLNNNSCLPDIFYPSPSSSQSGCRTNSYSAHSSPASHQDQSYLDQVEDQQPMFSEHSAALTFDPTPSTQSYNMDVPYNMYEQNSWSTFSGMPTQYPPLNHPHDESNFFPYNTTECSIPANMIPATPQPVSTSPPRYNFNTPIRTSSHYPAMSMRQAFTPDTHSMSSYSRSCSPNPSHIDATHQTYNLHNQHQHHQHQHRRQFSRSSSVTSSTSPLSHYGIPVRAPGSSPNSIPQAWRCAYPNCTSRATFIRGCDLRKHYNRHSKHLFCRVDGCPQSEAAAITAARQSDPTCKDTSQLILSGGFSSKKDRARHEAKHNPGIKCEWHGEDGEGCGRVFSRMDNMKDHVRRIHLKGQQQSQSQQGSDSTSSPTSVSSRKLKRK